MTEEKIELLKDTNPIAYEELIEFMPIQGYSAYKKDTLPSYLTHYLGVWKCPTGKHKWVSTISYRANKGSDHGCIICLNNKLGLVPKLIEQRLHYTNNRFILESLLYNETTYVVYWKREYLNMYDFSTVVDDLMDIMFTLKERYPIIAKEWSNNNFASADKIFPNDYCDYEFEWKCKKCGSLYKSSFWGKRRLEEYACPYCSSRLPFYQNSLAGNFPEVAKRWVKSLNSCGPEETFANSKKMAYFKCPVCGVVYLNSTENEVNKEDCQFCKDGVTMQYSERLYREAIYDNNYLPVERYAPISWKCEECSNLFNASPFDRFHKQAFCPYCSGKLAIPEKTSLKALYKELIDREWKFQNNTLLMNPRYELPSSKKRTWWICPICNNVYIYPINKRVKDYLRNRNSCTICKGRIRVKRRN